MKQKLLYQGAEAIILLKEVEYQGTLVPYIIKDRIAKGYRLKQLDNKIRKQRTKAETKLLEKASRIINAPKPIELNENEEISKIIDTTNYIKLNKNNERSEQMGIIDSKYVIIMPYIKGKKLSEHLDKLNPKQQKQVCNQIGKSIAKLHDNDIIHGDLTTSNMILAKKSDNPYLNTIKTINKPNFKPTKEKETLKDCKKDLALEDSKNDSSDSEQIYFIDFGLGFHSARIEDKAVDLHLIKQALEAKHFQHWEKYFKNILQGYKLSKNYSKTLNQLKKVEARGRYKKH